MGKIKVAVLRGGTSSERAISLRSGDMVAQNIPKEKYAVFLYDPKSDLKKLMADITKKKIDVVFPVLHGRFGEDGTIQGLLTLLNIPFIGSDVLTSALCMNKEFTKRLLLTFNIPTPEFLAFRKGEKIDWKVIDFPCVVKPMTSGSSVGITIVDKYNDFNKAVDLAFKESEWILIEKYIPGREITVGIIGTKKPKVLPPIEIIPNVSKFYNYEAKYQDGGSTHICPAKLPERLTKRVQNLALKIYKAVDIACMARIDFIYNPSDGYFYFLEINTIPGMTSVSLLPEAAKAVGISFPQLLDKLIQFAFEK